MTSFAKGHKAITEIIHEIVSFIILIFIPQTPEDVSLLLGIKDNTRLSTCALLSEGLYECRERDLRLLFLNESCSLIQLIIKFMFMIIIAKGKFRVDKIQNQIYLIPKPTFLPLLSDFPR